MKETQLLENIEQFLKWYGEVYGKELILNRPLSLPITEQASPMVAARPQSHNQGGFAKRVEYRQTSPELQAFYEEIKDCQACDLHKTRKNFVFGYGNAQARVMFVGEAPGREEDEQGLPFVGLAGKLLDKMLASIGLSREQVYIANVLKCRPPGNRNPSPEEIAKCEPYLIKQISMIKPELIVALGLFAARSLLKVQQPLSAIRKAEHQYQNIPVIVTYHPAALLRNPILKKEVWQDLKKIKKFLEEHTDQSS